MVFFCLGWKLRWRIYIFVINGRSHTVNNSFKQSKVDFFRYSTYIFWFLFLLHSFFPWFWITYCYQVVVFSCSCAFFFCDGHICVDYTLAGWRARKIIKKRKRERETSKAFPMILCMLMLMKNNKLEYLLK